MTGGAIRSYGSSRHRWRGSRSSPTRTLSCSMAASSRASRAWLDLIEFDDHVAFRFAYESKYRSAWDRGEVTDLVVVLR